MQVTQLIYKCPKLVSRRTQSSPGTYDADLTKLEALSYTF